MKRAVILVFIGMGIINLGADELKDARNFLQYGEGWSVYAAMSCSADHTILEPGLKIPVNPVLSLQTHASFLLEESGDTGYGGGIRLWLGAPDSRNRWRSYGGPALKYFFHEPDGKFFLGGYGGVEFFSSGIFSFSYEMGGGCCFRADDVDPEKNIFFLTGKMSYYLQ